MNKKCIYALLILVSFGTPIWAEEDEEFHMSDSSAISETEDAVDDQQIDENSDLGQQEVVSLQSDDVTDDGDEDLVVEIDDEGDQGAVQDVVMPVSFEIIKDTEVVVPSEIVIQEKKTVSEVQTKPLEKKNEKKSSLSDSVEIKLNINFDKKTGRAEVRDLVVVE